MILVTGGAGFIGSHLVDYLINIGEDVRVIDNESAAEHSQFYWNDKAENHKLDICDYESIRPLFADVDYVFHLAAEARIQSCIKNPTLATKTNTFGTANVLQCAMESGVKRVIYSSTSSAYGMNSAPHTENQPDDCLNPYSLSKVAGEKLCKMYYDMYGLETIILRYFNVYGDRQPMTGQYAPVIGIFERQRSSNEPLTIVGDGKQIRDFTFVEDVVQANVLAATQEIPPVLIGTVFNIGTGIGYSINDIADMFNHTTVNIPERLGETKITIANTRKARVYLGWKPNMSVDQWIKNI